MAGQSNWREALVATAIESSEQGWHRNPYEVEGAVRDWTLKFPDVAIVDDGKTSKGRGSTAFDLVRRVETDRLVRFDWLSIKTGTVEGANKVSGQYKLCVGNPQTIKGILDAVESGVSYATVFFTSKSKTERGYTIFADLAPYIREHGVVPIEEYPEGGYKKGKAPPFYVKWCSRKPSGVKRLAGMRSLGLPVDESTRVINGVRMGPGWIQYPELVVSLSALGVSRANWHAGVHVNSIPLMLDRTEGFGGTSEVTWENM